MRQRIFDSCLAAGAAAVCATVSLVGCAAKGPGTTESVPVRASTQREARVAREALLPLLRELGYPLSPSDPPEFLDGCKIGLVVARRVSINAGLMPGARSPCVRFRLFLTEGALRKLSVPQLRAVFAHELGHVHLGHLQARRARAEVGGLENWWILGRAYNREEEAAADEFAVRLLSRLEGRYPGACVALASVFELAKQGQRRPDWLSTHPSPGSRAQRIRTLAGALCPAGSRGAAVAPTWAMRGDRPLALLTQRLRGKSPRPRVVPASGSEARPAGREDVLSS